MAGVRGHLDRSEDPGRAGKPRGARRDRTGGAIVGLSLRLYRPAARQWTLNFSNIADGLLAQPAIGRFADGLGEFYSQEDLGGRAILSRFVISDITPTSCRFEQSFSDDWGATWEPNWIAVDVRIGDPAPDD